MENKPQSTKPQSRVKKRSNFPLIFILLLLLCGGAAYFFLIHSSTLTTPGDNSQQDAADSTSITPSDTNSHQANLPTTGSENDTLGAQTQSGNNSTAISQNPAAPNDQRTSEVQNNPDQQDPLGDPHFSKPIHDPAAPFINQLNAFYTHLDQQPYMKQFGLSTPSKVHFSELLQKLVDNPPTVSRETDDLFTLLKNTAHFFRILGKDNIIILKGILDREKPYVENILKNFYSLTDYPKQLEDEYQLSVPFNSLYDYAGFFLNTMGGRLYLFRRDSTSRMVVSYYAILIIDKANNDGNSSHGINLVPAIDFLIEEMEIGGKKLTMREDYLDTLYDLKEKYN